MKLRIGFIRLGAMGLSHAKDINRVCGDKAEVTALCGTSDANFQAATEVAPSAKRFKEPTKPNCIDGTLLAIAAERAIKRGEVVTVESGN